MEWGDRVVNLDVRAQMEGLYDFSIPDDGPHPGLYLRAVHSYLARKDKMEALALQASRLASLSPILKDRQGVVKSTGELTNEYVGTLYSRGTENRAGAYREAWEMAFGVKWGSREFHQLLARIEMDRAARLREREREETPDQ